VLDITGAVRQGGFNELTYRGLFNGKDYVAVKAPDDPEPNASFDARIDMRAFLVYWGEPGVQPQPFPAPYPRIATAIFLPRTLADFAP
jgi:hypothetical protein